tara:strand:- start:587 stop:772 length:186 start_codon:yes stop_codon:yes gene_type:complete
MSKLIIKAKRILSWNLGAICNDCEKEAHYRVKYPKLSEIQVCIDCYYEFYFKKVGGVLDDA